MVVSTYSPFTKQLDDLETSDLASLRETKEGWYIEYKREAPNASGIAKCLSAFSNTYGGWLFIGIAEQSKENPVAGTFSGVEKSEVDSVLQRTRKAAADLVHPTPYFELKVFWGPSEQLGLLEGFGVICAWVPQSASAPHVHKSGAIYRRVADASEPRPESDRHVLDQLWRRGDEVKRDHKSWVNRDPEFSTHEKTLPYIRVMLIADRWNERKIWIDADEDSIRRSFSCPGNNASIPFDTVHSSGEGFICRQLGSNDPYSLSLTWRLRRDLRSDVLIPLPLHETESLSVLREELGEYLHIEEYIEVIQKYSTNRYRIIDLNFLYTVLIGVVEAQDRLCQLAKWTETYHVKVKVLNAWRTIPFLDVRSVLRGFDTNGPPMCMDSVTALPSGTGPDDYFEVLKHEEFKSSKPYVQALSIFHPLALAFGIPPWIARPEGSEEKPYLQELLDAGTRAMRSQEFRRMKSKGVDRD